MCRKNYIPCGLREEGVGTRKYIFNSDFSRGTGCQRMRSWPFFRLCGPQRSPPPEARLNAPCDSRQLTVEQRAGPRRGLFLFSLLFLCLVFKFYFECSCFLMCCLWTGHMHILRCLSPICSSSGASWNYFYVSAGYSISCFFWLTRAHIRKEGPAPTTAGAEENGCFRTGAASRVQSQ